MRKTSVHQGHIETTTRTEEVPIPFNYDAYQTGALRHYALSLRQGGGPWTTRDLHFVELQGKEQEIVTVCEQYVEYLARLVKDFEDKHPQPE
jgi:hypothetical protein